jgi:hypothetical protein
VIVYEPGGAVFRAGEEDLAGRRIAGRLLPYLGEAGPGTARFDPLARRFLFAKPGGRVVAGPADPASWREASGRSPSGPVLVGPSAGAEEVRGSHRAAAEGALASGRPVYLLDPSASALPACGSGAVVLSVWRPAARPPYPGLAEASAAGFPCGALVPILPGWTAEEATLEALVGEAAAGGAVSVSPIVPALDGEARRSIVEAREAAEPGASETFFGLVHHSDWTAHLTDVIARFEADCASRGLATRPPRPVPEGAFAGNAAAAARLEERAGPLAPDEHRGALLLAAIRWIDESGRDLSAVAREGNFRKIFPFGGELALEAEAALLSSR